MKPCACCGSTETGQVIGVQWGVHKVVAAVFNCACGTTRYIPWADAPEEVRKEATLAEQARLAIEGAI